MAGFLFSLTTLPTCGARLQPIVYRDWWFYHSCRRITKHSSKSGMIFERHSTNECTYGDFSTLAPSVLSSCLTPSRLAGKLIATSVIDSLVLHVQFHSKKTSFYIGSFSCLPCLLSSHVLRHCILQCSRQRPVSLSSLLIRFILPPNQKGEREPLP